MSKLRVQCFGISLAGYDEHGYLDTREDVAGGVLACRAQHSQEHRKIDVRHMRKVRKHVFRVDALRVDLPGSKRDLQGELRR